MENFSADLVTLIRSASGLAKIVLVLLLGISVFSWGIILEKAAAFHKSKKARRQILNLNIGKLDPNELRRHLGRFGSSPLARVYQKVHQEYFSSGGFDGDEEALTRMLQRQGAAEISRLEARLGFLASAGSVSPFIGLFGTVWGVMRSFMNIGTWGSTSIAVVAPGIAEALIATAAGLAAAIPAVVAYNYFVGLVREESRALEEFSTELILAQRSRKAHRLSAAGGAR
jgi:biopolymer transport protein TolQ